MGNVYMRADQVSYKDGTVKDALDKGSGGGSAADVSYDNTSSGLTATDVQDAIDEVVGLIPDGADDVSYDNTSSGLTATDVQGAVDELAGDVEDLKEGEIYSTDEVKIGKWLGDDLFRKVYHVAALPNTTTLDVPTGLTDVNYISVRGSAYGDGNVLPLPYSAPGSLQSLIQISMSGNNIRIVTGQDRSNREADIVVEYTKTV